MGSTLLDLAPPIDIPDPTTILELRTGKLAPFGNVSSGIIKHVRHGRLFVSKLGLTDDEHDLTFHGGIDKAIHQYCADHYASWRKLYPDHDISSRFDHGSFGENLVTYGWNEDNVCAGDLISIGHFDDRTSSSDGARIGCVLEVSLPRQPCFKLNHRFGIKNFAPKTHASNRTGWYFRVVEEGWIEQGMKMKIIERRNPQWSIARLHKYVHREKNNALVDEALSQVPELGNECKSTFEKRTEQRRQQDAAAAEQWREFRLKEKRPETPRIQSFIFEAVEPVQKPLDIGRGCHIPLKLPNGLRRVYSVVDGTTNCFQLGVARDEQTRGGSIYMHDQLQVGDRIQVGPAKDSILYNGMASHHVFIAGGIGITAFLKMMQLIHGINMSIELHYCVRSADEVAFASFFDTFKSKVKIYDSSKGERLDIPALMRNRVWNSSFYVCGPQRMIDAVIQEGAKLDIPSEEIRYELFKADISGDPFTAEVETEDEEKKTVDVPSGQSLLEALRSAGLDVPSSCETGSCGTCKVKLKCGRVAHNGTALTEAEKEHEMLTCVSRGIGHVEISLLLDD